MHAMKSLLIRLIQIVPLIYKWKTFLWSNVVQQITFMSQKSTEVFKIFQKT